MLSFYKIKSTEWPLFVLWVLIASLYIRPYNGIMEPFYKYGNYLVFAYTTINVIARWKYINNVTRCIYTILVFGVVYLVISRLLNGYGYDNKNTGIYMYNIALINIFTIEVKKNTWIILRSFSFLLYLYICINFATILLYPDGLYETEVYANNWFLGYKNVMIRTILPGLALNMLCSLHDNHRFTTKDYILITIALLSVCLVESSTSIAMMAVFIAGTACMLFYKKFKLPLFKVFLVIASVSVAFSVFSMQSFLAEQIEAVFEKDATFTGRTYVWAFSMLKIASSPIIGYGWHTSDEWRDVLGFYDLGFNMGFSHPHNFILYTLLQGGFIYLALFVFLCYYVSKNVRSNNKYCLILTIMYLTYFIEGITESLTGAFFFFPLFGLYATLNKYDINK